jgi:hypothetical protein
VSAYTSTARRSQRSPSEPHRRRPGAGDLLLHGPARVVVGDPDVQQRVGARGVGVDLDGERDRAERVVGEGDEDRVAVAARAGALVGDGGLDVAGEAGPVHDVRAGGGLVEAFRGADAVERVDDGDGEVAADDAVDGVAAGGAAGLGRLQQVDPGRGAGGGGAVEAEAAEAERLREREVAAGVEDDHDLAEGGQLQAAQQVLHADSAGLRHLAVEVVQQQRVVRDHGVERVGAQAVPGEVHEQPVSRPGRDPGQARDGLAELHDGRGAGGHAVGRLQPAAARRQQAGHVRLRHAARAEQPVAHGERVGDGAAQVGAGRVRVGVAADDERVVHRG